MRRVDALTSRAIENVMAEALATAPQESDVVGTWEEIWIDATEVKLPSSLAGRDILTIGPDGYAFGVPVRHQSDGAWVRGPRSIGELPPIRISFLAAFSRLRITTYWSIWTQQGSGGQDVDDVVTALTAAGWEPRDGEGSAR